MKTKNIFRTLFMAVVLLFMGMGNIQAKETTIWGDINGSGRYFDNWEMANEIAVGAFNEAAEGDKVRIYASSTSDWHIKLYDGQNQDVFYTNSGSSSLASGYVEFTLTAYNITQLTRTDNRGYSAGLQGYKITVKAVVLVTSDVSKYAVKVMDSEFGTITASPSRQEAGKPVTLTVTANIGYEVGEVSANGGEVELANTNNDGNISTFTFIMPENDVTISATFDEINYESTTVWGPSSQTLNWNDWNNGHIDFSTSEFREANVGDIIRIKGSMGNSENWFNVQLVDMNVPNWDNNNNTGQWTSEEDGYIDAIISSDMLNQLKNNQTRALTGYNFIATEILWLYKSNNEGNSYSISISSDITNGTVTANPTKAKEGATVTLTITPNNGYELQTISAVDGEGNAVTLSDSGNTRTFTMPTSDVTVSATFVASIYSISISNISNGSITANPVSAKMGETVTLTIVPDNGYELQSISAVAGIQTVTLSGSGNTRTFTMPASNVIVTGSFVKERTYVPATISSAGYATFCSTEPLDFSGITTLKAYYATAVSDTEVTFKQVTGTVAAGTGLLLVGTTSQVLVAETGNECAGNLLVGVLENDEIIKDANKYVLVVKDGEVKFADTAAQAAKVPAGKAYLQAPSNSRILTFSFDGEATGISTVNTVESQKQAVYTLQGQRVTTMNKGLYIINGKKVMIK